MSRLTVRNLCKRYGDSLVVDNFDLEVSQGEFLVLLGPSGCGKTTTLRMIAGFVEATSGSIILGGQDITGLPPYRRNIGLVFQGYALFPHMTVQENVAFGLKMRKVESAQIAERVARALKSVRMDGMAERYPRQLSGGQQQRVALARALIIEPSLLLLDEPLSNLDAKLRQDVRLEISLLQRELGITTVLVTHDQDEALAMADRLVVMKSGVIQQMGTQRELYEYPRTRFVADFVGHSNFFQGKVVHPDKFLTQGGLEIEFRPGGAPNNSGEFLTLRPEKIRLLEGRSAVCANQFDARVELVTYLGSMTQYRVRLGSGEALAVHAANSSAAFNERFEAGKAVVVEWNQDACFVVAG